MTKGKDLFINFKILSLLFFCLILASLNKLKDQHSPPKAISMKRNLFLCCLLALAATVSLGRTFTKIPLPEHPRPDFERSEWINLNGPWAFTFNEALGPESTSDRTNRHFRPYDQRPVPMGFPAFGRGQSRGFRLVRTAGLHPRIVAGQTCFPGNRRSGLGNQSVAQRSLPRSA